MIELARHDIKAAVGVEAPTANTVPLSRSEIMSLQTVDGAARAVNKNAGQFRSMTPEECRERLSRRAAVRLATFTPLTISGQTGVLHLSRKRHALIDLADWQMVAGFMWTLMGPTRNGRFYAYRTTKETGAILLHRFITGALEAEQVDHWNNNGLDNRRKNLRRCDQPSNLANSNQRGREGLKGTYYDRSRGLWQAYIQCRGVTKRLGRFKTQREAADAYDKAARELFGEFALTNEEVRERSTSH